MPAPTDRALLAWWDRKAAQLRAAGVAVLTCADCGRTDDPAYVQPQHPYFAAGREDVARCGDCIGRRNEQSRTARKAELAARPKDCQRCGKRPHTWTFGPWRLCGRCKTAAAREHYGKTANLGVLGLMLTAPAVDTTGWAGR